LRWQEFDRDESLGFVVQSGGQPGVPGGGLRQVLAGMRAWNDDAGSRVALAVLGETSDLLRLSEPDGALSIMYEDPHDEIEGRFGDDGEKSGTLAVTRALRANCASHRIPGSGEQAVALTEVGIATQDGAPVRRRLPGQHVLSHAARRGGPGEIRRLGFQPGRDPVVLRPGERRGAGQGARRLRPQRPSLGLRGAGHRSRFQPPDHGTRWQPLEPLQHAGKDSRHEERRQSLPMLELKLRQGGIGNGTRRESAAERDET